MTSAYSTRGGTSTRKRASDRHRARNAQRLVKDLGASEVVDYKGELAMQIRGANPDGVDAVLQFGGDPNAVLSTVRKGGRLSSTLIMKPERIRSDTGTVRVVTNVPPYQTMLIADALIRAKKRFRPADDSNSNHGAADGG